MDRCVYLRYLGSAVAGAIIAGGGVATYYATAPPAEKTIEKTVTKAITQTVMITPTPGTYGSGGETKRNNNYSSP